MSDTPFYAEGFGYLQEEFDEDGQSCGFHGSTPEMYRREQKRGVNYGWGHCPRCDVDVWARNEEHNVCDCHESWDDMLHTHCPQCGARVAMCMISTEPLGLKGELVQGIGR
jgi:hypothetical protein